MDLYQASLKKIEKNIEMNFLSLTLTSGNVSTISGTSNLIEGSGRANIMLPKGIRFHINDGLYSSKSTRNWLSFKDIRRN